MALTQRACNITESKTVRHLSKNVHVAGQFQIAGHDITALRLKSKHLLRVLLIADADIYILHKVGHDLAGLFLGPELFAEV